MNRHEYPLAIGALVARFRYLLAAALVLALLLACAGCYVGAVLVMTKGS